MSDKTPKKKINGKVVSDKEFALFHAKIRELVRNRLIDELAGEDLKIDWVKEYEKNNPIQEG